MCTGKIGIPGQVGCIDADVIDDPHLRRAPSGPTSSQRPRPVALVMVPTPRVRRRIKVSSVCASPSYSVGCAASRKSMPLSLMAPICFSLLTSNLTPPIRFGGIVHAVAAQAPPAGPSSVSRSRQREHKQRVEPAFMGGHTQPEQVAVNALQLGHQGGGWPGRAVANFRPRASFSTPKCESGGMDVRANAAHPFQHVHALRPIARLRLPFSMPRWSKSQPDGSR